MGLLAGGWLGTVRSLNLNLPIWRFESMLDPQLDHYRKQSDRLLRIKRWVLAAVALLAFPLVMILPPAMTGTAIIGLLVVAFASFCILEVRRVMIFRLDVKERGAPRMDLHQE